MGVGDIITVDPVILSLRECQARAIHLNTLKGSAVVRIQPYEYGVPEGKHEPV